MNSDLRKFVEAIQISQLDERVQYCLSMDCIPEEIVQYMKDGRNKDKPIIIGIFGRGIGHAVLAYDIEESSDFTYIHVYDSNYPLEDRTIRFTKTAGLNFDWDYDLTNTISIDSTVNKNAWISYVPYEVYSAVWKDHGIYDPDKWADDLV